MLDNYKTVTFSSNNLKVKMAIIESVYLLQINNKTLPTSKKIKDNL